jgi:hypothetical protein
LIEHKKSPTGSGIFFACLKDQKIAAFGSSYRGNAFQMQELPKAAIFCF